MNEATLDDSLPPTPPGLVAQRVIAVPWRHAGLIGACALAGALASTSAIWPHAAPAPVPAMPRFQPIEDAPAGVELRFDLELGSVGGPMQAADATPSSSSRLRLDKEAADDGIDAMLAQAPPAAGRPMQATAHAGTPRFALPGIAAGLLLGLLAASLRELGGQRMRSPREAQWALGAPVLGAIPTLPARARDALVEPPPAA